MIDVWANNKLTSTDLKDVNGYKARLIQFKEMVDNLGYELDSMGTSMVPNPESTPRWVYAPNYEYWYWTMTPVEDDVSRAWYVSDGRGSLGRNYVYFSNGAVRPVINLLKSAI